MTYTELERRIEELRQAANLRQAISEVNQFMLEDHSLDDISRAEQLLISLENQQGPTKSNAAADGFTTDLAIVKSELEIGEFEHAFDGLKRLLREQPHNLEVQALLRELVRQDGTYYTKTESLLEELRLDASVLHRSTPPRPANGPTERQVTFGPPAGSDGAFTSNPNPLFERYQEAMRLYRTRYHDQAIEIFEEILHLAEPGSQLYQDSTEYRQKAEERLLAGEVPLDNIPYTAVDKQSQATSAIRLGDYESAIKLLDAAIQACLQAKVRYPPEWNSQFQSAREIHMAYKVREKGDIALGNGDLEGARQYWTNAQKVLEDAELDRNLAELQAARKAIGDGEMLARSFVGPSNEQQIRELVNVVQNLQKARTTFPQIPLIEETLSSLQQHVFRMKDGLIDRGEDYLEEARQANTLADRRRWLESALAEFRLIQALSGDTTADFNINRAQQLLQSQGDLENQLREADSLLYQGTSDAFDLTQIFNHLRDVKEVVPGDPQVRSLARRLRDQYLEHAERKLNNLTNSNDLRQAEEFVRIADNEFFGSPSEKLNSLRTRVIEEKQVRQRKTILMSILSVVAAIIILIPLGYFAGSRVIQPLVAPTATPTATFTPTATGTPTPTATPTVTPTPTATEVVLYGSVVSQVWVYNEPNETTGERISFVLQNQPVEVVESRNDDQGREWFKIRWTSRDSRNEGWIQGDRIRITGTN